MPLFRRKANQPAVVAGNATALDRRNLKVGNQQRNVSWQQEIANYLTHGPGVVGNYADTVEDKIKSANTVFKYQNANGVWEHIIDPQLQGFCRGVFNAYRTPYKAPNQSLARHARLLATAGECWLLTIPEGGKTYRYVAHPFEMKRWQAATNTQPGCVFWMNPYTHVTHQLFFGGGGMDMVTRSWIGEDDDPSLCTSELRRAIPHIRELIAYRRRGVSDSDSRLVSNGMMAFDTGSELYQSQDEDDPANGLPEVMIDILDMAQAEENTPYWERPPVGSRVPFPMIGAAPTFVEVGRGIEPALVAAEHETLLHLAHSLRCPTSWLVEGPASAKRNQNDDVQNALIDDCIGPIAERAYDDFNQVYFRPVLQQVLDHFGLTTIRADSIRAEIDLNSVRPRPDQSAIALGAWDRGLASRAAVQSVTQMDLLDIPAGWTDFQFWQFSLLFKQPQGGSGVGTADTSTGGANTRSVGAGQQGAIAAAASGVELPPFPSAIDTQAW